MKLLCVSMLVFLLSVVMALLYHSTFDAEELQYDTYTTSDPNLLEIVIPPEPPLSEIRDVRWFIGGEEFGIAYASNTNTIMLDGISSDDALRRMYYWVSSNRADPNEYLMSARISIEVEK